MSEEQEGGVNFASEAGFDRMSKAIRYVEGLRTGTNNPEQEPPKGGLGSVTHTVKITGDKDGDYWPAQITFKDTESLAGTWVDLEEELRVLELNGKDLTQFTEENQQRYTARAIGGTTDGYGLLLVDSSGGCSTIYGIPNGPLNNPPIDTFFTEGPSPSTYIDQDRIRSYVGTEDYYSWFPFDGIIAYPPVEWLPFVPADDPRLYDPTIVLEFGADVQFEMEDFYTLHDRILAYGSSSHDAIGTVADVNLMVTIWQARNGYESKDNEWDIVWADYSQISFVKAGMVIDKDSAFADIGSFAGIGYAYGDLRDPHDGNNTPISGAAFQPYHFRGQYHSGPVRLGPWALRTYIDPETGEWTAPTDENPAKPTAFRIMFRLVYNSNASVFDFPTTDPPTPAFVKFYNFRVYGHSFTGGNEPPPINYWGMAGTYIKVSKYCSAKNPDTLTLALDSTPIAPFKEATASGDITVTATPTGGTGPYTYTWVYDGCSGVGTGSSVVVTAPGSGIATFGASCSVVDSSTPPLKASKAVRWWVPEAPVSPPPPPPPPPPPFPLSVSSSPPDGSTVSTGDPLIASATPSGGTGPYTYSWTVVDASTGTSVTFTGDGTNSIGLTCPAGSGDLLVATCTATDSLMATGSNSVTWIIA